MSGDGRGGGGGGGGGGEREQHWIRVLGRHQSLHFGPEWMVMAMTMTMAMTIGMVMAMAMKGDASYYSVFFYLVCDEKCTLIWRFSGGNNKGKQAR